MTALLLALDKRLYTSHIFRRSLTWYPFSEWRRGWYTGDFHDMRIDAALPVFATLFWLPSDSLTHMFPGHRKLSLICHGGNERLILQVCIIWATWRHTKSKSISPQYRSRSCVGVVHSTFYTEEVSWFATVPGTPEANPYRWEIYSHTVYVLEWHRPVFEAKMTAKIFCEYRELSQWIWQ